jgi:hypothetical protein
MSFQPTCPTDLPSKCNPYNENTPKDCNGNLCGDDSTCKATQTSEPVESCTEALATTGSLPGQCGCNARHRRRTNLDVYVLNKSKSNLQLLSDAKAWSTFGKNNKECQEGFFSVPPPRVISSDEAIFVRATNGALNNIDQKRYPLYFTMCFTYGIDSNNLVHIVVGRARPPCPTPFGGCQAEHYNNIQNNSSATGNLTVEPKQIDRSTFLFTVTGGGPTPPPARCTIDPDNCPPGSYCTIDGTCMSGCKINPDSCPDGQICNPMRRTCETQPPGDTCSSSEDCNPGFFCDIPQGSMTGTCKIGCNEKSTCPPSQRCIQGQCQSVKEPFDNKNIIIISVIILIFIILIAGVIYFMRESSKSKA